jgi:hypothetical protein
MSLPQPSPSSTPLGSSVDPCDTLQAGRTEGDWGVESGVVYTERVAVESGKIMGGHDNRRASLLLQ